MSDDASKDDLKGKAKEGVGKATGDDSLKRQGQNDQAKSGLKRAADSLKSVFKR